MNERLGPPVGRKIQLRTERFIRNDKGSTLGLFTDDDRVAHACLVSQDGQVEATAIRFTRTKLADNLYVVDVRHPTADKSLFEIDQPGSGLIKRMIVDAETGDKAFERAYEEVISSRASREACPPEPVFGIETYQESEHVDLSVDMTRRCAIPLFSIIKNEANEGKWYYYGRTVSMVFGMFFDAYTKFEDPIIDYDNNTKTIRAKRRQGTADIILDNKTGEVLRYGYKNGGDTYVGRTARYPDKKTDHQATMDFWKGQIAGSQAARRRAASGNWRHPNMRP